MNDSIKHFFTGLIKLKQTEKQSISIMKISDTQKFAMIKALLSKS